MNQLDKGMKEKGQTPPSTPIKPEIPWSPKTPKATTTTLTPAAKTLLEVVAPNTTFVPPASKSMPITVDIKQPTTPTKTPSIPTQPLYPPNTPNSDYDGEPIRGRQRSRSTIDNSNGSQDTPTSIDKDKKKKGFSLFSWGGRN